MSSTNIEATLNVIETVWQTRTYTKTQTPQIYKQPDPPQAPNNSSNSLGIIAISLIVGCGCILVIGMITSHKINKRNNENVPTIHTANPLVIHINPLRSDVV
jgi:hypothetical protein